MTINEFQLIAVKWFKINPGLYSLQNTDLTNEMTKIHRPLSFESQNLEQQQKKKTHATSKVENKSLKILFVFFLFFSPQIDIRWK